MDRARRAVWRRSDEDRGVRCGGVVGVEKDGRLAVGEPGFEANDPSEGGGLGDEEGDEDDVFHIGVVVVGD